MHHIRAVTAEKDDHRAVFSGDGWRGDAFPGGNIGKKKVRHGKAGPERTAFGQSHAAMFAAVRAQSNLARAGPELVVDARRLRTPQLRR